MQKKFYISLLTLLFFISTTSLPLSMHLCKMADSVSTEECAACMAAEQQKKCCSDNLDAAQVKLIKAQAPLCCSTEFVDAKVKDNFISAKTDVQNINSLKFTVPVTVDFSSDPVNRSFSFKDKDSSPPTLQTNHLYLLNSIFLI